MPIKTLKRVTGKALKQDNQIYLVIVAVALFSLIVFAAILAMAQCDPNDLSCISMP